MTTLAHTALGLLGWQTFVAEKNRQTLLLFTLLANLPDIDFTFFLVIGRRAFDLHQSYTHNLFFVTLIACLCWPLLNTWLARFGLLLTGLSHLLIDFLTIDARAPIGFPLFYPFSEQRTLFGFLPNIHKASPAEIFSIHNLLVAGFEILLFWGPLFLLYRKPLASFFFNKKFKLPVTAIKGDKE